MVEEFATNRRLFNIVKWRYVDDGPDRRLDLSATNTLQVDGQNVGGIPRRMFNHVGDCYD